MGRYNADILFAVTRIRSKFVNSNGVVRSGIGTGFFLRDSDNRAMFVTNKHNLDANLRGLSKDYDLIGIEIELRQHKGKFLPNTRFVSVKLNLTKIMSADTADVSIIFDPQYISKDSIETHYSLNITSVADASFHNDKVEIMDHVSFLGFPGTKTSSWWDTDWNVPTARIANIASLPYIPFSNKEIITTDVTLVSGLSFSGSSGSLVLLHQKGFPPGDVIDPNYVPAKIIGIMSGHFNEQPPESEVFRHSGLSYYTRSTSILELIKAT